MNLDKRIVWADQAKGLAIFLMVYAHNSPLCETYIYTFHMPLFFFVSGLFHPKKVSFKKIFQRAKQLLIPYFIWSMLLYLFWFLIGRNYGVSADKEYNWLDNLLGIFYAQGDNEFMNWGIPMWFIPCLFISFLLFSLVNKIPNKYLRILSLLGLIIIGFSYPIYFSFDLPWSIDIACVSLIFYSLAFHLKSFLINLKYKPTLLLLSSLLILYIIIVSWNPKVDMYRAIYNNELLFAINGISGTLILILLLKLITLPKIINYIGKHTIIVLALHLRVLTIIKLVLLVFGVSSFDFNEFTKILLAILQVVLILPLFPLINRYTPILNGKIKK